MEIKFLGMIFVLLGSFGIGIFIGFDMATAYIICRTVKEHFIFYREKWNTGTRR